MKLLICLMISISVLGCRDRQSVGSKVQEESATIEAEDKTSISLAFKPDSSYVEFWCSIEVLKNTSRSIDVLDLNTVAEFLASFNEACKSSIEFHEWSNELLFHVVNNKPGYVLQLLHKNNSLDLSLIKHELRNPVSDGIEIGKIINRVEEANAPDSMKNEIIEALKEAK